MPNELFNNQDHGDVEATPEPRDQPSLFHVGEGKKYHTVEDLDKAYGHANEHIAKLEQELNELRDKASKSEEDSGALNKILETLQTHKPADQQEGEEQPDVEEVVRQVLQKETQKTTAQQNAAKVREAIVAKYGDKAGDMYKQRGEELGVDLDALAQQSPDAVIALFGGAPTQRPAVPTSSVNTSTLTPRAPEDPDRALYKEGKISREEYFRRQWRAQMKQQ